ncbi:MAG TPA: hypothetical protein VE086_03180, partial [Chthoniobacterales bacterium]|nr:hypothetical protein [Chthoniobacterales bacterium]
MGEPMCAIYTRADCHLRLIQSLPRCGEVFQLLNKDENSRARRGRLTTSHGVIETPAFMPVGTQGSVKAVSSRELI